MAADKSAERAAVEAEDKVVAELGDVPSGVRRVPRPGRAYDARGNVRPDDGRNLTGEEGEDARVNAPSRPADKYIPDEVLEAEKRAAEALAPKPAKKTAAKSEQK